MRTASRPTASSRGTPAGPSPVTNGRSCRTVRHERRLRPPVGLVLVPIFAIALLLVRGVPAAILLPIVGARRVVAAALLQATSLPFIVAATQIGLELGLLRPATAAALVTAGLLSVLLFPVSTLAILRRGSQSAPTEIGEPNAMEAM